MTDRIVHKIFCSKAKGGHMVGSVVVTSSGYVVTFRTAVHGPHGPLPEGHEVNWTQGDAAEAAEAWCKVCRKTLPINLSAIVAAAGRGDARTTLDAEGMWRDPLGVLERKHGSPMR